jgi:hypothetical protein
MGSRLPKMTLAAFLEKHEFVRGEVFAMASGRRVHGLVLHDFSNAARIELASLGCALDRDELFEGVEAEPRA